MGHLQKMKHLSVVLAIITAVGLICNSKSAFVARRWSPEDPKVPFPYGSPVTNEPFPYPTTPSRVDEEDKWVPRFTKNPCQSSPCKNGGKCSSSGQEARCVRKQAFQ